MRILVTQFFGRPPASVWEELERFEAHHEWMKDAEAVRFVGDQRRGVGTVFIVPTRVGPFRTEDRMEVTTWHPPRRLVVEHRSRFRGQGTVLLTPAPGGTVMVWEERLRFPWTFGGPLGAVIAKPVLRAIWRGNLDRLRARLEASGDDE